MFIHTFCLYMGGVERVLNFTYALVKQSYIPVGQWEAPKVCVFVLELCFGVMVLVSSLLIHCWSTCRY